MKQFPVRVGLLVCVNRIPDLPHTDFIPHVRALRAGRFQQPAVPIVQILLLLLHLASFIPSSTSSLHHFAPLFFPSPPLFLLLLALTSFAIFFFSYLISFPSPSFSITVLPLFHPFSSSFPSFCFCFCFFCLFLFSFSLSFSFFMSFLYLSPLLLYFSLESSHFSLPLSFLILIFSSQFTPHSLI